MFKTCRQPSKKYDRHNRKHAQGSCQEEQLNRTVLGHGQIAAQCLGSPHLQEIACRLGDPAAKKKNPQRCRGKDHSSLPDHPDDAKGYEERRHDV